MTSAIDVYMSTMVHIMPYNCSERALALYILGVSLGGRQDMYTERFSRQCCKQGAGCYDVLVRC